ncbi:hypothetical protein F2Q69_00019592 [Brassica cretica]|uniref:Uncharacterized protein n=1 Tax=Brassica cretica TaxID=69181 RepID=A0A8S9QAS7_BRACR|nr:hypothetical protein F2Q69_00019592 [Brassica cretica]
MEGRMMCGRMMRGRRCVDGDECKNSRSFIRANSTIAELNDTTPTTISSSKTIGQKESAPLPKPSVKKSQLLFPVSHTMDSELNIVVDELGEAAVVRARHNPPP